MQNKPINSISQIVRGHRKKSGLTQAGLAKMAGVGKTAVFDVEHGKKSVQLNTLFKILKILNIKISAESTFMEKTEIGGGLDDEEV